MNQREGMENKCHIYPVYSRSQPSIHQKIIEKSIFESCDVLNIAEKAFIFVHHQG